MLTTSAGSGEVPPVENWRIFRRLIGHDNDVQDLGWACDSSILVSVGLDSKVVVWSGYTFEKLKTITNHQSHVKGITFDPANKYFATASDDRSIKVFRFTPPGPNSTAHDQASNFVLEKTISDPFQGSPLTTYFRRCSWSPDGAHISGANAVNGPVSSAAIIDRGSWGADIHLIGHEGPVEVTAFCPRLWSSVPIEPQPPNSAPLKHLVTVIACASQDKSISLWITSNSRPIVIAQDVAHKSISDLAWSPDGKRLFATSLDGSIICLMFGERDLGYSASLEENEKALAKFGGSRKGIGLLESPEALVLEEGSKAFEMEGVEGRMGALMGDDKAGPHPNKQANNGTAPTQNGEANGEAVKPNDPPVTDSGKKDSEVTKSVQDIRVDRIKQRVTITKDGKKRISPLLVSGSSVGESTLPRAPLRNSTAVGQGSANDAPQTILDLSKPFDGLPKGGLATLLLGNRRRYAAVEGDEENIIEKRVESVRRDGAVPILQSQADGLNLAKTSANSGAQPVPEYLRPAVVNPSLTVSQLRLAVPKLRASIARTLDPTASTTTAESKDAASKDSSDVKLEVKNATGPSVTGRFEDREPARIMVTKKGQPIWLDFVPKSVLLVSGGSHFWAAACEDGSIYTWTPAGRRIMNALVVESQPVILESMNSWLLCITAAGQCYVWNMESLTSLHPPISLAPVLDIATTNLTSHTTKAPSITSARLNSEGRIMVTLANGDGYAYNPALFAWQRLSEVWWAVGSQYWNTMDTSIGNLDPSSKGTTVSQGVIPYLEKQTTNEMLVRGRAYFMQRLIKALLPREGYETLESSISIGHLENRLAAAMMLGSKNEFQTYLYMYARRLGPEGLKLKAEELLRGLLGSLDSIEGTENSQSADTWGKDRYWKNSTDTLCGWSRRELLRGVVLILGTFSFWLMITTNEF
jgi:protein HIRA/HIR1